MPNPFPGTKLRAPTAWVHTSPLPSTGACHLWSFAFSPRSSHSNRASRDGHTISRSATYPHMAMMWEDQILTGSTGDLTRDHDFSDIPWTQDEARATILLDLVIGTITKDLSNPANFDQVKANFARTPLQRPQQTAAEEKPSTCNPLTCAVTGTLLHGVATSKQHCTSYQNSSHHSRRAQHNERSGSPLSTVVSPVRVHQNQQHGRSTLPILAGELRTSQRRGDDLVACVARARKHQWPLLASHRQCTVGCGTQT
jgi:hypothetical protein